MPQTTHHRDIPDSVIVTRKRHAFDGQSLAVISSIRRTGVLYVLAVLPDGSRSLIPASWTDWSGRRTPAEDADKASHKLGSLADLLQARTVVDALLLRLAESAAQKESCHADEPGIPRATSARSSSKSSVHLAAKLVGSARRGQPQRGPRHPRSPHVGVPHNDHVTRGLLPSLGPEIEAVVQVDVGEQR